MFNSSNPADDRFTLDNDQVGRHGALRVFTDSHTGVQYLVVRDGPGLAVTPLLNTDGKPLVAGTEEHA